MSQAKAGRPRKSEKYAGHIVAAEDRIADRLPDLIDNLLRLAEGVWIEEADLTGKPVVYQKPPDFRANTYLIDRLMGKPPDRVEHTGEDGGPVQVHVYLPDNGRDSDPGEQPAPGDVPLQ